MGSNKIKSNIAEKNKYFVFMEAPLIVSPTVQCTYEWVVEGIFYAHVIDPRLNEFLIGICGVDRQNFCSIKTRWSKNEL